MSYNLTGSIPGTITRSQTKKKEEDETPINYSTLSILADLTKLSNEIHNLPPIDINGTVKITSGTGHRKAGDGKGDGNAGVKKISYDDLIVKNVNVNQSRRIKGEGEGKGKHGRTATATATDRATDRATGNRKGKGTGTDTHEVEGKDIEEAYNQTVADGGGGGVSENYKDNKNNNNRNNLETDDISSVEINDDYSSDDESTYSSNQKEKNNKIIVGIAVKPGEKPNSKKYLMNDFDLFTVYNSLPYSTVDNVDDFLKNFFKFIQTKRDDNGKILSYDNYEDVTKKDITYFVIDPLKYSNENENGKDKDSNSDDGDSDSDESIKINSNKKKGRNIKGGKKTRKTSKKSRKTKKYKNHRQSLKKSQKKRKQN